MKFFECKVNNNQRFIHGHNGRGKNNGMYNTSKFSGKDSPYWIQREIRYCACGCGQFKEVKSNSKWKFVQYHHMKDKEVLKKRGIKLSENAKINPNYGMKNKHHTKETKEKISFIGTGRPSLKKGKKLKIETIEKMRIVSLNQKPTWYPKTEKIYYDYINEIGLNHKSQYRIKNIARVDDYWTDYNTVVQVDGCYFHNCFIHYPNTFKERRERDEKQDRQLRTLGYKILRIWEHDINNGNYKKLIAEAVGYQKAVKMMGHEVEIIEV